jgi:hypothetical protein
VLTAHAFIPQEFYNNLGTMIAVGIDPKYARIKLHPSTWHALMSSVDRAHRPMHLPYPRVQPIDPDWVGTIHGFRVYLAPSVLPGTAEFYWW